MLRVIFVGSNRARTFELFRRTTQYPNAQNANPAVIEVTCQSKTFEVWCTNGDAFEPNMLYTQDAVYVAVVESAYADLQRPWYVQQFGTKLYFVELDGSIITTMDTLNQRMYVDAQFSAVECLMRDIAMKNHVMQLDVVSQIRTKRTFCVDNKVVTPKALNVWMNYMLSLGKSVIRISELEQPNVSALVVRLMSDLRICVAKGNVAIIPHFSTAALRQITTMHSVVIYDFVPKLSLISCLARMSNVLDFDSCSELEASVHGVYYATPVSEVTIEEDRITIASLDSKYLSAMLRACTEYLRVAQFACYCNFCNIGVIPRHYCGGRIDQYGYPLKDILTFIRHNTMQCGIETFEHIAIVKPKNRRVELFGGGELFNHFEAHRLDLHLAYIEGIKLVSLEPNFKITEKYDAWVQGVEYKCVDGVLQDFAPRPTILSAGITGYLSLPYAIPCLSLDPPPYPALHYTIGFISTMHTMNSYTAAGATVYNPK